MDKSFYKYCQEATKQAIADGAEKYHGIEYLSIDGAVKALRKQTSPDEWSKDYLFERAARLYIAICAGDMGYRSGDARQRIYFPAATSKEFVSKGLVVNAQALASAHATAAEQLASDHEVRFGRKATDGQLAFDDAGIYEEMSVSKLVAFIKEAEKAG